MPYYPRKKRTHRQKPYTGSVLNDQTRTPRTVPGNDNIFVVELSRIDELRTQPRRVQFLVDYARLNDINAMAELYNCSTANVWQRLSRMGQFVPDGSQWIWRSRPNRNKGKEQP